MKLWLLAGVLLILSGCATTVPEQVRRPLPDAPDLARVLAAPERFVGREVRWGGSIAGVDNRADETCIEVVGRELQTRGRPLEGDRSQGRFLACIDRFLDPAIFAEGRLFTVRGEIEAVERRPVGAYPYPYPRVRISSFQLWEPRPEPVHPPYPYFGPHWDPFWHGPWPSRYGHLYYHPYFGRW